MIIHLTFYTPQRRKLKYILTFFVYTFFIINLNAQHHKLIDSLEKESSKERRRIVLGYMESRSALLAQKNQFLLYLNQVEGFARSKKDKDLFKEIEFIKYKKAEVFDKPKSAWEDNLNKLIEKYKQNGNLLFLGYCYHEIGQLQFQKEQYELAFESNLKALEAFKKLGYENVPNIGKVLHEIALNYYFFKDYEEVRRLMRISIRFPPFSRGLDMQRYNNLGMSYKNLNQNDSAKYFFKKGLHRADVYNADIWKGLISGNLGELYYDEKKYDSSFYHFQKNYRYNANEAIHNTVKLNSYINMSKIYLQLDSIKKAAQFLETSKKLLSGLEEKHVGDKQQVEKSKFQYFQIKIKYLKKIGNFKRAILYQDSLSEIRTKLDTKYNTAILKISSNQVTIQDKDFKLAQKEKEKKAQSLFYIVLLIIIIILGGVGYYFMYISRLKKKRQSKTLLAQNRNVILEKQQTQKELQSAKNEIQYFVSKINEQSKIVSKFEEDLKTSKSLEAEERKRIDATISKLKGVRILTDEDWINFQGNFDKVFPDFKFMIKKKSPTITSSEIRYLMLTKLHFSHKEMAIVLGVSDSTIRVTWNRVRKRLNGTLEDTPITLIEKILQPDTQVLN